MAPKTLTPEDAALFAQLAGVQGQQDLAENEMAKAAALRKQPVVHAGGKWGGIAAGLANAVNGIDAAITDRMGIDQKRAAAAQNAAANQALFDRYAQLGQKPAADAPQISVVPTGVK